MCDALRLRWHVERHHGSSIGVRVIDGGPFSRGREFDLTAATKQALGFPDVGTVLSSR
jgi:rare lipoprotein A